MYNGDGLRTEKWGDRTTQYIILDGTYLGERTSFYDGSTYLITYIYGAEGSVIGLDVNGTAYYFVKNLQGDVTSIIDANGNVVANYTYDAYGYIRSITDGNGNEVTSATHIANLNPFRYRGYMYDQETGFYYLTSRYYDPAVCRFLNADGLVSTGQGFDGYNMFAYCGNNPVMRTDTSGHFWQYVVALVVVIAVPIVIDKVKDACIDRQESISKTEKEVAKEDPVGALLGNRAKNIANEYQEELYPNTYIFDGNQANAFKHAMWNAVMTDKMGERRAKEFADAHEQEYLNDAPELCEMDLFNNNLGRQIALEYAGEGYDVFAEKIYEAINNGEAYVIFWDEGN